eukprot:jgi/Ulvmu1/7292/UM035_0080.1
MRMQRGFRAIAQSARLSGICMTDASLRKAVSGGTVQVPSRKQGPILTDTRLPDLRGAWFLALQGPSHDGHHFLLDCIDKGAAGIIVSNQWLNTCSTAAEVLQRAAHQHVGVVAVPDTTSALAQLCQHAMNAYDHTTFAITGSCGKTTCKSMVATALRLHCKTVHEAPGSYNNHIGVPLTALSLPSEAQAAVFEFGTNTHGEIEALSQLIQPDVRVITDVQPAHLAGLKGVSGVADEKLMLFRTASPDDLLVFNSANTEVWDTLSNDIRPNLSRVWAFGKTSAHASGIDELLQKRLRAALPLVTGQTKSIELVRIGSTWAPRTTVSLSLTSTQPAYEAHDRIQHSTTVLLQVPALGDHLDVNAAAAAAVTCAWVHRQRNDLDETCLEQETAWHVLAALKQAKWLEGWTPPPGRMTVHHIDYNVVVIDDSYNANPASMLSALNTLQKVSCTPWRHIRRLAVLGTMAELGCDEAYYHSKVASEASRHPGLDCFTWGKEWTGIGAAPSDASRVFLHISEDRESALFEAVSGWIQAKCADHSLLVILLKGSRCVKMERVLHFLRAQEWLGHRK